MPQIRQATEGGPAPVRVLVLEQVPPLIVTGGPPNSWAATQAVREGRGAVGGSRQRGGAVLKVVELLLYSTGHVAVTARLPAGRMLA